eukprot:COSAG04_NODE_1144_length_8083_cov_8.074649_1_plen_155_part_00
MVCGHEHPRLDFKDWLATHEVGTELPEYFDQKESKSDGVHGESKHGGDRHFHEIDIDKSNRHHPILSRVQKAHQNPLVKVVAAPVTYTGKLLDISYQMAKKALPSKTTTEIDETALTGGNALLMEARPTAGGGAPQFDVALNPLSADGQATTDV